MEWFHCQNCHLPLELDSSLLGLSEPQQKLIINSVGTHIEESRERLQDDQLNKLKHTKSIEKANESLSDGIEIINPVVSFTEKQKETVLLKKDYDNGKKLYEEEDDDFETNDLEKTTVSNALSSQIQILTNMFNILSTKTNFDYPICEDCCQLLTRTLRAEVNEISNEKKTYSEFLNKLEKEQQNFKVQVADDETLHSQQNDINSEKDKLLQRLSLLEKEDNNLDKQIHELEEKLKLKQEEAKKLLKKANLDDMKKLNFNKNLQDLNNKYEISLNSFDTLRKTNIYNETFNISHDGPFGTINGLRLGGFNELKVSWREINAALGQIILLLNILCEKLNCKLNDYKLQPMGSVSRISKFDQISKSWVSLEAYNDENFKFTKLFHRETNFDKSLVCLLEIIKQLSKHVLTTNLENESDTSNYENDAATSLTTSHLFQNGGRKTFKKNERWMTQKSIMNVNENFKTSKTINSIHSNSELQELPYIMLDGKINAISVKLYGNEPNLEWSTAMKFVLTNVKWLLAFSSHRLSTGG